MPITVQDLTINFEHVDRAALLADWEWLIGPTRLPILVSAIGDAFVQDTGDGSVHQLDTNAGVADLEVHLSITGQLHRQIAELSEGTPIESVRIEEP